MVLAMRLIWTTDIHLNFLSDSEREAFYQTLVSEASDGVLVGGDIGEATNVLRYLSELESKLDVPIYFVLGNHDFYRSSLHVMRAEVARLVELSERLVWLTTSGVVSLSDSTALIGHDGWYDGRLGDYFGSEVVLNDFFLIRELVNLPKPALLARLNEYGDEVAEYFARVLPEALKSHSSVILLTHVPPFREACWYDGQISSDDYLPFFSCKVVGEVLRSVMEKHPSCELTVLCAHTHGEGSVEILPNLKVYTGRAVYGRPEVQRVWEVG